VQELLGIPLRELWEGFNPLGVLRGTFVLLRGYIDESYRAKELKTFALSCLIATGSDWLKMERSWKLHLAVKNRQLKKEGRRLLSRYHATDCASMHGDYEGWTVPEQIEFVQGLLDVFRRTRGVHAVGYTVDLDELCTVFPEWAGDRLETAYSVLMKFVMYTIGDDLNRMARGNPVKVTLFHDRTANGKYDPTILRSFDYMLHDANFSYPHYFTTIAPLMWQDCIALQPADLVAFEVFKDAQGKVEARKRRKSLSALLDLAEFGIRVKAFDKKTLIKMREHMESVGYKAIPATEIGW